MICLKKIGLIGFIALMVGNQTYTMQSAVSHISAIPVRPVVAGNRQALDAATARKLKATFECQNILMDGLYDWLISASTMRTAIRGLPGRGGQLDALIGRAKLHTECYQQDWGKYRDQFNAISALSDMPNPTDNPLECLAGQATTILREYMQDFEQKRFAYAAVLKAMGRSTSTPGTDLQLHEKELLTPCTILANVIFNKFLHQDESLVLVDARQAWQHLQGRFPCQNRLYVTLRLDHIGGFEDTLARKIQNIERKRTKEGACAIHLIQTNKAETIRQEKKSIDRLIKLYSSELRPINDALEESHRAIGLLPISENIATLTAILDEDQEKLILADSTKLCLDKICRILIRQRFLLGNLYGMIQDFMRILDEYKQSVETLEYNRDGADSALVDFFSQSEQSTRAIQALTNELLALTQEAERADHEIKGIEDKILPADMIKATQILAATEKELAAATKAKSTVIDKLTSNRKLAQKRVELLTAMSPATSAIREVTARIISLIKDSERIALLPAFLENKIALHNEEKLPFLESITQLNAAKKKEEEKAADKIAQEKKTITLEKTKDIEPEKLGGGHVIEAISKQDKEAQHVLWLNEDDEIKIDKLYQAEDRRIPSALFKISWKGLEKISSSFVIGTGFSIHDLITQLIIPCIKSCIYTDWQLLHHNDFFGQARATAGKQASFCHPLFQARLIGQSYQQQKNKLNQVFLCSPRDGSGQSIIFVYDLLFPHRETVEIPNKQEVIENKGTTEEKRVIKEIIEKKEIIVSPELSLQTIYPLVTNTSLHLKGTDLQVKQIGKQKITQQKRAPKAASSLCPEQALLEQLIDNLSERLYIEAARTCEILAEAYIKTLYEQKASAELKFDLLKELISITNDPTTLQEKFNITRLVTNRANIKIFNDSDIPGSWQTGSVGWTLRLLHLFFAAKALEVQPLYPQPVAPQYGSAVLGVNLDRLLYYNNMTPQELVLWYADGKNGYTQATIALEDRTHLHKIIYYEFILRCIEDKNKLFPCDVKKSQSEDEKEQKEKTSMLETQQRLNGLQPVLGKKTHTPISVKSAEEIKKLIIKTKQEYFGIMKYSH